jgi:hypothetical protein
MKGSGADKGRANETGQVEDQFSEQDSARGPVKLSNYIYRNLR